MSPHRASSASAVLLELHLTRFAQDLAELARVLAPGEARDTLHLVASALPRLGQGEACVRVGSRLSRGLGCLAHLLVGLDRGGEAPRRMIGRILGRLTRLLEVGAGLPAHQQRPRLAPPSPARARSLRGPRRSPARRQVATERG
ncbi:MAG: hypothetical protein H6706_10575 [Myxococcales bacterium]|nr:hypothetical protein [Myxococcales bacterium]